ncbi:MAG: Ig-like domain-containing protein [Thermoplasmata archaeon]
MRWTSDKLRNVKNNDYNISCMLKKSKNIILIFVVILSFLPSCFIIENAEGSTKGNTIQLYAECEENMVGLENGSESYAEYVIYCYAKPSCLCTNSYTVNMSVYTNDETLYEQGWNAKLYNSTGAEISSMVLFGMNYFNLKLVASKPENATEGTHAIFNVTLRVDYEGTYYANVTTITSVIPSGNRAPELLEEIQNVTIQEDTEYISEFDIVNKFYDPDDDPLVVKVIYGHACNYTAKIENRKIHFEPAADWFGNANVRIFVSDYYWQLNFTMNFTVEPSPDAPRIRTAIPSFGMLVNTTDSDRLNLSEIFYDPDGEELEYNYTGGEHVNIFINESGQVTITSHDWTGTEYVTFSAIDPTGRFVNFTISIVIVRLNQPPEINNSLYSQVCNLTIPGDVEYVTNFSVNELFYDDDGDSISYITINDTELKCEIIDDGKIKIIPQPFVYGKFNISVLATDGYHNYIEARFCIEVLPVNHPPAVVEGIYIELEENESHIERDLISRLFIDPDGDNLTISFIFSPYVNMTLIENSVLFEAKGICGTYTLQITAFDGKNYVIGLVTVRIKHVDHPPYIVQSTPSPSITISENETAHFSVVVKDDDGDEITYQWLLDGIGSPLLLGNLTDCTYYANYESAGVHTVTFLAYANGSYAIQNWTVVVNNVNRPPVALIKSPFSEYKYPSSLPIEFSCRAYDPDKEVVVIEWRLGGLFLSNEEKFSVPIKAGKHTIELKVSDGNLTSIDKRTFIVENANSNVSPDWLYFVFIVISIFALGLGILFSYGTYRTYIRFKNDSNKDNKQITKKTIDNKRRKVKKNASEKEASKTSEIKKSEVKNAELNDKEDDADLQDTKNEDKDISNEEE